MRIWKDIEGYDGKYQISNYGEVRSFSKWSRGRTLKGGATKGNPNPYKFVALVKTGRKDIKFKYIHRLVAEAFIDNPLNLPEVNHKNGNTLDNMVDNLEWCTHAQNMYFASQSGVLSEGQKSRRGSNHPKAKAVLQFTKNGVFVKEWESVNQVTRETGIPANAIFKCCNPKKYPHEKSAYGYKWRYKNGETNYKKNT